MRAVPWSFVIMGASCAAIVSCVREPVQPLADAGADPATVALVAVQPSSAILALGARQQFEATALDESGNPLGAVSFSWTATGGTVTADGLFTAGNVGGSYEVVAIEQSGLADTADVSITAAALPPPGADEPVYKGDESSYNLIYHDDFESYVSVNGASPALSDVYGVGGSSASWANWALDAGRTGINQAARAIYQYEPDAPTFSYNPGTLIYSKNLFGSANPDQFILQWWGKSGSDNGINGKMMLHEANSTSGLDRVILGLLGGMGGGVDAVKGTYWYLNPDWTPIDPVTTPPKLAPKLHYSIILDSGGNSPSGYTGTETQWSYWQNIGWDKWRAEDDLQDTWTRWTVRYTKAPAVGQGRIEVWANGNKVIEYIGDDPARPEYGLVMTYLLGSPQHPLDGGLKTINEQKQNELSPLLFYKWLDEIWVFSPAGS